jgi:hypothetical protein
VSYAVRHTCVTLPSSQITRFSRERVALITPQRAVPEANEADDCPRPIVTPLYVLYTGRRSSSWVAPPVLRFSLRVWVLMDLPQQSLRSLPHSLSFSRHGGLAMDAALPVDIQFSSSFLVILTHSQSQTYGGLRIICFNAQIQGDHL